MSKIRCKKCGATANSKCPYSRNVFMDNQKEGLLSNIVKQTEENGWVRLSIRKNKPEESIEEALTLLIQIIKEDIGDGKDQVPLNQFLCLHEEWEFLEPCELGCHKKEGE